MALNDIKLDLVTALATLNTGISEVQGVEDDLVTAGYNDVFQVIEFKDVLTGARDQLVQTRINTQTMVNAGAT